MFRADSLAAGQVGQAGTKRTTVRSLPAPVAFDADDRALLNQTLDYYHQRLQATSEAAAYLKAHGLAHPELIATFKLGVADRTLGLRLPEKTRKAGADIRARLQKVGLIRESGHEHFNGSLVIPVFDEGGNVVEVYGRKLQDNLRPGTPKHLYLPGPHAGVFNRAALTASRGIILAESLIDALTFWCAGYRNVTAAYGLEGFTDELLAAFKAHGTTRVLIAYDRDDAGERAAEKLSHRLMADGIECWRVQFPKGMDANEYAQKMQLADKALGLLIRKAVRMGNGAAPKREASAHLEVTVCDLKTGAEPKVVANGDHLPGPSSLAAEDEVPEPIPVPTRASPLPEAPKTDTPAEQTDTDLMLVYGERRYRVRGWKKPLTRKPCSTVPALQLSRPGRCCSTCCSSCTSTRA